jgi:hypothetical protein
VNLRPWLAENEVGPGDNIPRAIGNALETSDAIVVPVSKRSLQSSSCRGEWEFAISSPRHANRVVPVLTPGTPLDDVPWILKRLRHVKGSQWGASIREAANILRSLRVA